jgi:hypothetical protein
MYGGDLRPRGFTELLFELVARHRRDADLGDARAGVSNFLPWPVHVSWAPEQLKELSDAVKGVAELIYLSLEGEPIPDDERQQLSPHPANEDEWAQGLTAMRGVVTKRSDARIVLGGKVEGFMGRMPGIAEEALTSLRASQPLFVLGGFGGCAGDIAADLGLSSSSAKRNWPGRGKFTGFTAEALNNGLDGEENAILANTVHVDQAVTLILRGLLRKEIGGASVETEA